MFKATIIAGAGGFIGTCLRFLSEKLGGLIYPGSIAAGAFPIGTFIANVVGCYLIGVFYGWASKRTMSKSMNLLLITGLCGGFTTFSSLSDEMVQMLESGQDSMFWAYMLWSLVMGIVMVALGIASVKSKVKSAQATNS